MLGKIRRKYCFSGVPLQRFGYLIFLVASQKLITLVTNYKKDPKLLDKVMDLEEDEEEEDEARRRARGGRRG